MKDTIEVKTLTSDKRNLSTTSIVNRKTVDVSIKKISYIIG